MEKVKDYWNERYKSGLNSGRGSYGIYKVFKSKIINKTISENDIKSITDFGCGDGNQINDVIVDQYVGLDIAPSAINLCNKKYENNKSKSFDVYDHTSYDKTYVSDLSMSIDVIYHIFEDDIYKKYISDLFNSATKMVLIYSTNWGEESKRGHVKHIEFTNDIPEGWKLKDHIKNETDNTADFFVFIKK